MKGVMILKTVLIITANWYCAHDTIGCSVLFKVVSTHSLQIIASHIWMQVTLCQSVLLPPLLLDKLPFVHF